MPSKAACNKIKDPVARKRCLQYKGEFAKKAKKSAAGPTNEMSRVRGGY